MQAFMRAVVLTLTVIVAAELVAQTPAQTASPDVGFPTPGVTQPTAPSMPAVAYPALPVGPTLVQQPGYGSPPPSRRLPQRDPTQPSRTLREAIDATNIPTATGGGTQAAPLPRFSIKARIVAHNAVPVALLSVDEAAMMSIRPGAEYAVPSASGSAYRIKVIAITASGIEMDLLPVNLRLTLQ
jgi:hypothetical protein